MNRDLAARINRLRQQSSGPAASPPASVPLRDRLARLGRQPRGRDDARGLDTRLAQAAGGEILGDGLILVERCIADLVTDAAGFDAARAALPGQPAEGGTDWVLVDTETTGLAGGTGTVVFQVGMLRATPEGWRARQWLLTRLGAESAMLQSVREWCGDVGLVSYNGRCFDAPLLVTRCRLHRVATDWLEGPHLDLLYPVRRAFARQWPDCRLATVERELLGLVRDDDLPGSQAPQAWLDYLRQGSTEPLVRVLRHNLRDLASLVELVPGLAAAYRDPLRRGADVAAVARAWAKAGRRSTALEVLRAVADRPDGAAGRLLGELLRQDGRWEEARTVWEGLARAGDAAATEQLAKYFEHVARDYPRAAAWAERLPGGAASGHRLARLRRRLAAGHGQETLDYPVSK